MNSAQQRCLGFGHSDEAVQSGPDCGFSPLPVDHGSLTFEFRVVCPRTRRVSLLGVNVMGSLVRKLLSREAAVGRIETALSLLI